MADIDVAKTCLEGYVCVSAAIINNPTDTVTGYICPVGNFCLANVSAPTPCLLGSYRATEGGTAEADCTVCVSDEICNDRGLAGPTGIEIICAAGNYCPTSNTIEPCDAGHFCIQNVLDQSVCVDGYY
jgi:hypothetical protein